MATFSWDGEAIPSFLGHGKTSARDCSLFEQPVCPIPTEAKHTANLRPSSVEPTLNALEAWRNADAGHFGKFPNEAFASVRAVLPRLVRPSTALDRQHNAKRLRTVTGHQAKQVQIVCDVRPVFDHDQTMIEGFVALTTLKLVYETQTKDVSYIEVMLSPELVEELMEKTEKAKAQLQVLKESVHRWIPGGLSENTQQITDEDES